MTHKTNGRFPWERLDKMKAARYARDLDATRDLSYGEKFADFFRLCDQGERGEVQIVLATFPEILGDNYEELVSNLWRCAKAGLLVAFVDKEPEAYPSE